jgi:hypothetical protein
MVAAMYAASLSKARTSREASRLPAQTSIEFLGEFHVFRAFLGWPVIQVTIPVAFTATGASLGYKTDLQQSLKVKND